jgi:hypothetical protein
MFLLPNFEILIIFKQFFFLFDLCFVLHLQSPQCHLHLLNQMLLVLTLARQLTNCIPQLLLLLAPLLVLTLRQFVLSQRLSQCDLVLGLHGCQFLPHLLIDRLDLVLVVGGQRLQFPLIFCSEGLDLGGVL